MKVIDLKGNHVANFRYSDGTDVRVGDYINAGKMYVVLNRVWSADIGEITTLIVREATANDLNDE